MRRRAAGIPAERPLAGRLGVQTDRLAHVRGFVLAGEILVVDPFEAVGRDLPIGLAHGGDRVRIAGSAVATPKTVTGLIPRGERPPQPPEAGARAVLEHRFHVHVALAAPGLRAEHVGEKRLRGRVAMQDRVLAALLEIHHELQGDAGPARPARIGGVRP